MKKFDEMFKQEQNKIAIEKDLAAQQKAAKAKVIIDFCEEHIFDFLDYLQNKFYIRKHSVNYHVDGETYEREIVYSYNRENAKKSIKDRCQFKTGIQCYWSNGGIFDTLTVNCVNFKPVLKYEGERVTPEKFIEKVISQIQNAIDQNFNKFQIIEK
jgi:hypothetical protein